MVVPIFKGEGDAMSYGAYRGVKLLEHAMKIVERMLEKRIRCLVKMNKMQFGFMPGRETIAKCSVYSLQNARGISR